LGEFFQNHLVTLLLSKNPILQSNFALQSALKHWALGRFPTLEDATCMTCTYSAVSSNTT
jgi:hypothetical protein